MSCPINCAVCDNGVCRLCHKGYHVIIISESEDGTPHTGCGAEVGGIAYCMELSGSECAKCSYMYTLLDGECALKCGENMIANCEQCLDDKCLICHNRYIPGTSGADCRQHNNMIDHCVVADDQNCLKCQFRYSSYKGECISFQCNIDFCVECTQGGTCRVCGDGKSVYNNSCVDMHVCGINHCLECIDENPPHCLRCANGVTPVPESQYRCFLQCGENWIRRCAICGIDRCELCEEGYNLSPSGLSCILEPYSCQIPGCTLCESYTSCASCDTTAGLIPSDDKTRCIQKASSCLCGAEESENCITNCFYCTSRNECMLCKDGYFVSDSMCIEQCPKDTRPSVRYRNIEGYGLIKFSRCARCLPDLLQNCDICNYNEIGCRKCLPGYHGSECKPPSLRETIGLWIFAIFLSCGAITEICLLAAGRLRRKAKIVNID